MLSVSLQAAVSNLNYIDLYFIAPGFKVYIKYKIIMLAEIDCCLDCIHLIYILDAALFPLNV